MTTYGAEHIATVHFFFDADGAIARRNSSNPDWCCFTADEAVRELAAGRGAIVRAEDAAAVGLAVGVQAVSA